MRSSAKTMLAATLRLPFSWCAMRSNAGGKMIACARHTHKRAHDSCRLLNGSLGIAASTSTFLQVSLTTCVRWLGQRMSREGRMAMRADARARHARLWERRERQAFRIGFDRPLLSLEAGAGTKAIFYQDSPTIHGVSA